MATTNQYTLYDAVTIVVRHSENEIQQAYVAGAEDKKSLESARLWARSYKYDRDDNGKIIKQELIEGEEYTYKNNGFRLQFCDCAYNSSQGGKLSFWNCILISPDDKKFLIGINTDLLLDLIKESTIVNGEVKDPVVFIRNGGNLGVATIGGNQYKLALSYVDKKKEMGKGKTTKWETGYNYETLSTSDTCVGAFKEYFEFGLLRDKLYLVKREVPKTYYVYGRFNDCRTQAEALKQSLSRSWDFHSSYPNRKRGSSVWSGESTSDAIELALMEARKEYLKASMSEENWAPLRLWIGHEGNVYFGTYEGARMFKIARTPHLFFISTDADYKFDSELAELFKKCNMEVISREGFIAMGGKIVLNEENRDSEEIYRYINNYHKRS